MPVTTARAGAVATVPPSPTGGIPGGVATGCAGGGGGVTGAKVGGATATGAAVAGASATAPAAVNASESSYGEPGVKNSWTVPRDASIPMMVVGFLGGPPVVT